MGAATFKTRKLPNRQVTERAARARDRCGKDASQASGRECQRLNGAACRRALTAEGALRTPRNASADRRGRQNLENVKLKIDQKVVYIVSDPISETGGAVGLQSSLAPDGAMAKVAEMSELLFPEALSDFPELSSDVAWPVAGGKNGVRAVANRRHANLASSNRLAVDVCEANVVRWREASKAPVNPQRSGVLRTYADEVEHCPQGRGFPCGWEGESCL